MRRLLAAERDVPDQRRAVEGAGQRLAHARIGEGFRARC